jgi:hypothetical protein
MSENKTGVVGREAKPKFEAKFRCDACGFFEPGTNWDSVCHAPDGYCIFESPPVVRDRDAQPSEGADE